SRKKPSRGVVATQLGLPRPALRNADCVVREAFLARWINSSLISNGLKDSNLRSVRMSVTIYSSWQAYSSPGGSADAVGDGRGQRRLWPTFPRLGQHHDQDHSPDCQ